MSDIKCPSCGATNSSVKDSRPGPDSVRRRRVCADCGERFTTYEVLASVINQTRACAQETYEVQRALAEAFELVNGGGVKKLYELQQAVADIFRDITLPNPITMPKTRPPRVPKIHSRE